MRAAGLVGPLRLNTINCSLFVEQIDDFLEPSDFKELDVTALQLLLSQIVDIEVDQFVLQQVLLVVAGIELFDIRADKFCGFQLKKSSLIFVQENFHKVFDFPNGFEDVEDIELAINTILTLLIEENLTLAWSLPKGRPLTENQAANHALQDAESL